MTIEQRYCEYGILILVGRYSLLHDLMKYGFHCELMIRDIQGTISGNRSQSACRKN